MRSPYCYNCNVSISQRFKIRGKATRSVNGVTHTSLLQKYKIDLYGNLENNDHESDDYRFPESFLSYEDYKNLQALLQKCCEENKDKPHPTRGSKIQDADHPLRPVYVRCVELRKAAMEVGMPDDKCLICGSDLDRDKKSEYPYCPTCSRFILQNHKIRDRTTIRNINENKLCVVCHNVRPQRIWAVCAVLVIVLVIDWGTTQLRPFAPNAVTAIKSISNRESISLMWMISWSRAAAKNQGLPEKFGICDKWCYPWLKVLLVAFTKPSRFIMTSCARMERKCRTTAQLSARNWQVLCHMAHSICHRVLFLPAIRARYEGYTRYRCMGHCRTDAISLRNFCT